MEGYVFKLPEVPKQMEGETRPLKEGESEIITHHGGGRVTREIWKMPQDLIDTLSEARDEYARLRAAGTPYWCVHEDRAVDHPAAYWKEDGYFREDGLEMQYKHGVMCGDCGGYIQEG